MMIEVFLQAVIYTTTAIATLRAGSRAMYASKHNNEMGVMDGPLILSPENIAELRKRGNMEGEVSPLWESTFGFSEAVRLLREESQFTDNVVAGNWKEEEETKGYYSMASPQKTYHEFEVAKVHDDSMYKENDTETIDQLPAKNETSLVVLEPKTILRETASSYFRNYILTRVTQILDASKVMKALCLEVWNCHPLLGGSQFFFQNQEEEEDEEEEADIDTGDQELDFDTFYTETIDMPKPPVDDDLFIGSFEKEIDRVAHIKSFAPKAFRKLRSKFGIREEDFLSSLIKSGPYVSFQSNSKGAARVGGFFFFSRDGAYMVKTIKKAEIKAVLEMLPKYYSFMKRNARRSLLTRLCGLYSVKLADASDEGKEEEERCFLIMNSVFPAEASQFISERFDLKGSTVGRECSKEERESKGSHAVLKDLDLLKEVQVMHSVSPAFKLPDSGICIGPTAKAALLSQLRKDLSLLVECSVMDYSLLVGVVNMDVFDEHSKEKIGKDEIERMLRANKKIKVGRGQRILSLLAAPMKQLGAPVATIGHTIHSGILSTLSTVLTLPFPYYGAGTCGVDGGSLSIINGRRLGKRAVYYIGVIDFLQPWTTQKVLENKLKGVLGYDKSAISCVDPKEYAERFLDFMDKVII